MKAGLLVIEPASYSASYGEEPIALTKKEFDLLLYLWQHEHTAVTRDDLLTHVWGYDFAGDTNIVDVYIRYLRQKIDDRFGIKTIHTIRAVGYMFRYE
jgi:DNA-binding response OmpR family regulator